MSIRDDGPNWPINAPRVDQDTAFSFEVTVTVDGVSDSTTVNGSIQNIVRSPLSTQWDEQYGSISDVYPATFSSTFPGLPEYMVFSDPVSGHDLYVGEVNTSPQLANDVVSVQSIYPRGFGTEGNLVSINDFNLDTQTDFAVLDDTDNRIIVHRQTLDISDPFTLEVTGDFTIPGDACAVISTQVGDGLTLGPNEYPGLLIGTEGDGLFILPNDGNPRSTNETPEDLENAGRFSSIEQISTSDQACEFAVGRFSQNEPERVYAYDDVRRELTPVDIPVTTSPSFGTVISIPGIEPPVQLIDMDFGIGQGGQGFLALLFGSGYDFGNFLVILQGPNGSDATTITLPEGRPADMVVGNIDFQSSNPQMQDFDDDIVIAVPETPYVYVFENTTETNDTRVSFADVRYFEVGFDVKAVGLVNGDESFGRELIIGTEEEARLYQNTE